MQLANVRLGKKALLIDAACNDEEDALHPPLQQFGHGYLDVRTVPIVKGDADIGCTSHTIQNLLKRLDVDPENPLPIRCSGGWSSESVKREEQHRSLQCSLD